MGIDQNTYKMLEQVLDSFDCKGIIELGRQTLKDGFLPDDSAEGMYRARFGVTQYDCIDLRGGTFEHDLNQPFQGAQLGWPRYDAVTNFGTTEHIFNQAQVWETMHLLCKPGGLMFHALPGPGWGSHGFYGYTEDFIDAVETANGYTRLYYKKILRKETRVLYLVAWRQGADSCFNVPGDPLYFKEEK